MSRGLFVVFEGGDGVGKSTQVRLLAEWLRRQGRTVLTTFEPGDTPVGRRIRSILLSPSTGDLDSRAEALLYAADKAQHLHEVVLPALHRGEVVISDRYIDSMLAYQGAGRVLEAGEVEYLARWATDGLRPDLTILLDVEPAQAVGAIVNKDRLEDAGDEFHARARQGFLDLAAADPSRYLVLRGRGSRTAIAAAVRDRLMPLLSAADGKIDA